MLKDERENQVPDCGLVLFRDAETHEEYYVDTGSYLFKRFMGRQKKEHDQRVLSILRSSKVEVLPIHTKEDYAEAVVRFFQARKRRG